TILMPFLRLQISLRSMKRRFLAAVFCRGPARAPRNFRATRKSTWLAARMRKTCSKAQLSLILRASGLTSACPLLNADVDHGLRNFHQHLVAIGGQPHYHGVLYPHWQLQ